MKKRILIATLIITLAGLTVYTAASVALSYDALIKSSINFLKGQINVYEAERFENNDAGAEEMSGLLGGLRVTFIGRDGVVTGDSGGAGTGTDHGDREEITEAIGTGSGSAVRRSDTIETVMIYYCKDFGDRLVRIAAPTSSEWRILADALPLTAGIMIADVALCFLFSYLVTGYALKPVRKLAEDSSSASIKTGYKELEPIAEILERKNREISSQLELIRLEQSRAEAARASKDEFIANVTHEMNTPLTSIKGFAELMESGGLDEKTEEKAVHIIKSQAERLTGLIACIINYSELDSDDLPRYECDACETACEVAESLRADIESKGLTLDVVTDGKALVISRREYLTEVFGNLIRNATKYNKEGGGITVRVKGGDGAYAEISDTGIGIAEENREKIFSRFFTVDKSHGGKHGGFGLGLAVVKKLCDKEGWKLSVESVLGEGTTFRIEF